MMLIIEGKRLEWRITSFVHISQLNSIFDNRFLPVYLRRSGNHTVHETSQ